MQLDRARIAIRERSWTEILDLSLQVMRTHAAQLVGCALMGIVPAAMLNFSLISWLSDPYSNDPKSSVVYWLVLLVMIETPLATAPITLYLGQALFVDEPQPRQLVREFLSSLPQMLLLQLFARIALILPIVTWIVPYGLWPYLNEVILLERNPLRSRAGQMSTLKRNSLLHRGNSGEFMATALGTGVLATMLAVALYWTQETVLDTLLGFKSGNTASLVEVQVALWLVAAYFAVVRFLGYLDKRIRNEGWEVELLLRAQRERLLRQLP